MSIFRDGLIDGTMALFSTAITLKYPELTVLTASLSPVVSSGIKMIIPETITERESSRVKAVVYDIILKISHRLGIGDCPRNDDFYNAVDGCVPNAQEVYEGVLLKSREESQAKKLAFYSTFFANLCFDETIDIEHSHYLLNLIERLTYRQLVILAYLSDGKVVQTNRWDALFKDSSNEELIRYYDFYSEYVDMYNIRLITQTTKMNGFALGMSETKISMLGLSVSKLLSLDDVIDRDIEKVEKYFTAIAAIIGRI